jgi:hypothetical protein
MAAVVLGILSSPSVLRPLGFHVADYGRGPIPVCFVRSFSKVSNCHLPPPPASIMERAALWSG